MLWAVRGCRRFIEHIGKILRMARGKSVILPLLDMNRPGEIADFICRYLDEVTAADETTP